MHPILYISISIGVLSLVLIWGYYTYLKVRAWVLDEEQPYLKDNWLAKKLTLEGITNPYFDGVLWSLLVFAAALVVMVLSCFLWTRLLVILAVVVIIGLYVLRAVVRFRRTYRKVINDTKT